jgi:hypothetical protein
VPNADIGAGSNDVLVSAQIHGLQPDTTYHYRVVAVTEVVPGLHETIDGPDKTLTTPALPVPPGEEGCANERLRAEQPFGLLLPDCRAYEMVSPLDKGDHNVFEGDARASFSGEAVTYASQGSFGEPAGAIYVNRYEARRGPTGWSTRNLMPPYNP